MQCYYCLSSIEPVPPSTVHLPYPPIHTSLIQVRQAIRSPAVQCVDSSREWNNSVSKRVQQHHKSGLDEAFKLNCMILLLRRTTMARDHSVKYLMAHHQALMGKLGQVVKCLKGMDIYAVTFRRRVSTLLLLITFMICISFTTLFTVSTDTFKHQVLKTKHADHNCFRKNRNPIQFECDTEYSFIYS